MPSTLWKSIYVSPIVLGMTVLLSAGVMAAPKSTETTPAASGNAKDLILNKASGASTVKVAAEPNPATTTPEVSNGIVKPGDWQYTALQQLSTKYGCNPNFNNQPVLAVEFARGLNACINRVETSLALQQRPRPVNPVQSIPPAPPAPTVQPNAVTQEDLEVLKRLTQEFRAQLTEIDNKIVTTDKKIAQVQATQFSTTTKLKGEAVFNVSGVASGATQNNTIFGDRVRILLESSFTGKDKLWTRIATGNNTSLSSTFNVPSSPPLTSTGSQPAGGTGAQVIDTNSLSVTPMSTSQHLTRFR
jgi:Carbohydrate-selective porin, OprB family